MSNRKDPELNSIFEGFNIFGTDSDGLINPNELKEIMDTMNMRQTNPFLYNIIENFCSDPEIQKKGGIELDDFISKLNQESGDVFSLEGIQKLFTIFYNPITNTIPITTFPQVAKNIEENETEEILNNLIIKSQNVEKQLNFNEFYDIVKLGLSNKKIEKNEKNENIIYKKKSSKIDGRQSFHNYKKNNIKNIDNYYEINNNINYEDNNNNINNKINNLENNIMKINIENSKNIENNNFNTINVNDSNNSLEKNNNFINKNTNISNVENKNGTIESKYDTSSDNFLNAMNKQLSNNDININNKLNHISNDDEQNNSVFRNSIPFLFMYNAF